MCHHVLLHCGALHTDIPTATHHAEMTVGVNDQIRKVAVLFSKKHANSVISLDDLLK